MKTYNDLKGAEKTIYQMEYDFCVEAKGLSHDESDKLALLKVEKVYKEANAEKGEWAINLRTGQRFYRKF